MSLDGIYDRRMMEKLLSKMDAQISIEKEILKELKKLNEKLESKPNSGITYSMPCYDGGDALLDSEED